jgi:hypothetical protein
MTHVGLRCSIDAAWQPDSQIEPIAGERVDATHIKCCMPAGIIGSAHDLYMWSSGSEPILVKSLAFKYIAAATSGDCGGLVKNNAMFLVIFMMKHQ